MGDKPNRLINSPVVLVHLTNPQGSDIAACCGAPWTMPSSDAYKGVPRILCPLCRHYAEGAHPGRNGS